MKRTPGLRTGDILILRGALGRVKEHSGCRKGTGRS